MQTELQIDTVSVMADLKATRTVDGGSTKKRTAEQHEGRSSLSHGGKRARLSERAAGMTDWDADRQAKYIWDAFVATASGWLTDMELQGREFGDCVVKVAGKRSELATFVNGCMMDASLLRRKEAPKISRPYVLVIAPSGIRAAELARQLHSFGPQCIVAKLFAKHLKIEDQIKFLQEKRVRIAVGTPDRIQKLIENGALSLQNVELVVLDTTVDAKQRTIYEIPEVLESWTRLLDAHIGSRLAAKKTRIGVFGADK